MKRKITSLVLFTAFLLCTIPTTIYAEDTSVNKELSEIEHVSASFLSSLARNTYLYEKNDFESLTLAALPQVQTAENKIYTFEDQSLTTNDILKNIQYIENMSSFDSFYRQEQGITRDNFEVNYKFYNPEIRENTATINTLETISFYYTDDPLNDEITFLTNHITVQLIKENGNWYVADICDDFSYSDSAKAREIDWETAIKEAVGFIATEKETAIETNKVNKVIETAEINESESSTEGTIKMTSEEVENFLTGLVQNNDADIKSAENITNSMVYSQTRYIPFDQGMALQYAYTYWYDDIDHGDNYGPNDIQKYWRNCSTFSDYGNNGGNCQNFASQLAWAGLGGSNTEDAVDNKQIPMDKAAWYGSGDMAASGSWVSCSNFRTYTGNIRNSTESGLVTTFNQLDSKKAPSQLANYSSILPGSILHVYNPGGDVNKRDMGHAIYCTKVTGSTWSNVYYVANSNSAYNARVGDQPTWVGPTAVKEHVGVTHIVSYRDKFTTDSCSSHIYDNSNDATCSKCGYNRMILFQNNPVNHMNISPNTTKTIGGKVGITSNTSTGSSSNLNCYRLALGVTDPSGHTEWYGKSNSYFINQSINFNQEGIWTIQFSARDQDDSLSDSTAKTYTFKIRVIDYEDYNAANYN